MGKMSKVKDKIRDHMLLGSIYDNIMLKVKYNDDICSFRYNIMMGQKHRMLYYKRLKKEFLQSCTQNREWEQKEKKKNPDTIWFCWLQGLENAPELVKECYHSLQENIKDKKIVFIDENNLADYVQLPDYIMEKHRAGIIGGAHFSDLIRMELLIKYGGYWMDATVLCTDASMLPMIDKQNLFMYSFYYFGFNPEVMRLNNWFIYSETNNNILCLVREFMYAYWKKYDRALDYFVLHLFLTIATKYYREEYLKMPIVSQVDAHILASYIYDPFDQDRFELLKLSTGFHKLSTRFQFEKMQENSFYDIVIRKKGYKKQV